jgi:hypothetical protein
MNLEEQGHPLLEESMQTFFKTIIVGIKNKVDSLTNYFIGDNNLVEKRIKLLYKHNNKDFMNNLKLLKMYYTSLNNSLFGYFPDPNEDQEQVGEDGEDIEILMQRRVPESLRQDAETQMKRVTDLLYKIHNIIPGLEGGAKRRRRRITHKRKHHKKKRTNKNRK